MSKFFPKLDDEFLEDTSSKQQKSNADLDDLLKQQLQTSVKATVTDSQGYVSYDWQDPSTNVTYTIREKAAPPPVGDFRTSPEEAQNRFRLMMGEPLAKPTGQREEIINEEPKLEDSKVFQDLYERRKNPQEALKRAKLENQWTAHREKMPEDLLDASDREILDKPDVPANRIGSKEQKHPIYQVPTENHRGLADAPKRDLRQVPSVGLAGLRNTKSETLVEKSLLKHDPIKNAQVSAFRALVLPAVQMEKSQSEVQHRQDTELIVRQALDHGLVGPTVASEMEAPRKEDVIAQNVGRRALDGFLAKSTCPEIQELPLAQRDLVTLALGRTIVHLTEESFGLGAPEYISKTSKTDSSLQRTGHGPAQVLSQDKVLSDVHVSDRALQHNAYAHASSKGHGMLMGDSKVFSELTEQGRRTNETLVANERQIQSYSKHKTQAEQQEAVRRKDTVLKKMLTQGCNPDLVREILRPEVLKINQRTEVATPGIKHPQIEGPTAQVESIVTRSRKSEPYERTIRPSQDFSMRQ